MIERSKSFNSICQLILLCYVLQFIGLGHISERLQPIYVGLLLSTALLPTLLAFKFPERNLVTIIILFYLMHYGHPFELNPMTAIGGLFHFAVLIYSLLLLALLFSITYLKAFGILLLRSHYIVFGSLLFFGIVLGQFENWKKFLNLKLLFSTTFVINAYYFKGTKLLSYNTVSLLVSLLAHEKKAIVQGLSIIIFQARDNFKVFVGGSLLLATIFLFHMYSEIPSLTNTAGYAMLFFAGPHEFMIVSMEVRLFYLELVYQFFGEKIWFGYGTDFVSSYVQSLDVPKEYKVGIHNNFLRVLIENGLIATSLYVAIVVYPFFKLLKLVPVVAVMSHLLFTLLYLLASGGGFKHDIVHVLPTIVLIAVRVRANART